MTEASEDKEKPNTNTETTSISKDIAIAILVLTSCNLGESVIFFSAIHATNEPIACSITIRKRPKRISGRGKFVKISDSNIGRSRKIHQNTAMPKILIPTPFLCTGRFILYTNRGFEL